jgi:hypothetical protein
MKITSLLLLLSALFAFAQDVSSSPKFSDFEKSLAQTPSQMDAIYKIREELFSAVKTQDTVAVANLVDELSSKQRRDFIPIMNAELEVVFIRTQMFGRLLNMLEHHYKSLLDSSLFDENPEIAKDDGLALFVANDFRNRDTSNNIFYSIEPQIKRSSLDATQKKKLEMMLFLRDAYRMPDAEYRVRELAEEYINENPNAEDTEWIRKCIYEPLKRMNIEEYYMEKGAQTKEFLIKEKLYSGGFGANVYLLLSGFGIGFKDFYRKDLYEPESTPVALELYLQISRFAFIGEIVNTGLVGVGTYGIGFGVVVFDSRYLKIRPYIEYGFTSILVDFKEKGGNDMSESTGSYTLAMDVDFKFASPYLFASNSYLASFCISAKFGLTYLDMDNKYAKGKGVTGFFDFGFGIYLW